MEYLVHQGDSLDIVWNLPGVTDDPKGGITLDLEVSHITLTFADGSSRRLEPIKDWAIMRDVVTRRVDAMLSVSDTSVWAVGDIGYQALFVLKSGQLSNRDSGTISVLEPNGEPQVRDAKPWDLLMPWEKVVTDEVKQARLKTCEGCPAFDQQLRRCNLCGCFMDLKAGLARSTCPAGNWGPDTGVTRKQRKAQRASKDK